MRYATYYLATRARTRRRAALARILRALACALILFAAPVIGAIAAAAGQLAADPTDRHHYRLAMQHGNFCYALYGILCEPDPYAGHSLTIH